MAYGNAASATLGHQPPVWTLSRQGKENNDGRGENRNQNLAASPPVVGNKNKKT